MKLNVQKTFVELISYVDFPALVYMNQTGRIIARNHKAELIIGGDSKNVKELFGDTYKTWYRRGLAEQRQKAFYNVKVEIARKQLEIDLQLNVIPYENQNVSICFFEQSYKMVYERNMLCLVPRLFYKRKDLKYVIVNYQFQIDYGLEGKTEFTNEDFLEQKYSKFMNETERDMLEKKCPDFSRIHMIKDKNGKNYFIKLNRIPVINRDGEVEGILGTYMIVLNRDDYKEIFDATLRQKQLLSRIVSEQGKYVITWYLKEGWPIEYVSSNFDDFGYARHAVYTNVMHWARIIHPKDLMRIQAQIEEYIKNPREDMPVLVYRIQKENGRYVWIEDITYAFVPEKNTFLREGMFSILPESCYKELESKIERCM